MEKQKEQNNQKRVLQIVKISLMVMAFCCWFASSGEYALAAADIGKNAGTWILDQIFWAALVAIALALVVCLIRKAWVTAVITVVGGGIVLVFIKSPTLIETIGSSIARAVGIG